VWDSGHAVAVIAKIPLFYENNATLTGSWEDRGLAGGLGACRRAELGVAVPLSSWAGVVEVVTRESQK